MESIYDHIHPDQQARGNDAYDKLIEDWPPGSMSHEDFFKIGFAMALHASGWNPGLPVEVLTWRDVNAEVPDADITVLCWGSEGFFTGYWDDELSGWIACESGGSVLGVTHWAEPNGPKEVA